MDMMLVLQNLIDGYVIEVYDEKSYNRDKNIEKLI